LGRAYSNDGISWAEDEENPLLFADDTSFRNPWVVTVDTISYVWVERQTDDRAPRQTIHFTTWPKIIADGEQAIPRVVPIFSGY
jgi:hypothetical protein